jgi:putative oxidoreductase
MTTGQRLDRVRTAIAAEGWALLPLRLLVGFGFAAHGYAKLVRGPAAFGDVLAAIGIPALVPTAWVTSVLEFVGGISVMLGAAVVPLSVPFAGLAALALGRPSSLSVDRWIENRRRSRQARGGTE